MSSFNLSSTYKYTLHLFIHLLCPHQPRHSIFSPLSFPFHFLIHLYTLCSIRMLSKSEMRRFFVRARGAISIAQELKETFIVALFSFVFIPRLRFVLWDFFLFYGLPSSKIGFSRVSVHLVASKFLIPSLQAAPHRVHRTKSLFEDNIIQNTSRFLPFLPPPPTKPPESLILRTIFHLFLRFAHLKFVTHLRKDRFSGRCFSPAKASMATFYFHNI